jgi:HK97 gp10 family phage protein
VIGIRTDVKGVEQLSAKLAVLDSKGAVRASGKAIRAGLRVYQKAQQAAAPVKTGRLKKSINIRFRRRGKGSERNVIRAIAGLNVARKGGNALRAPHAHLVALGTQPRWAGVRYGRRRLKGGKSVADESRDRLTGKPLNYRGVMPANPFVRQASMAAEPAAEEATRATLKREISAEIAKAS